MTTKLQKLSENKFLIQLSNWPAQLYEGNLTGFEVCLQS